MTPTRCDVCGPAVRPRRRPGRVALVLFLSLPAASGCPRQAGQPSSRPTTQPASGPATQARGLAHLFNGKDLTGWKVLKEGFYDAAGKVYVQDGQLILSAGQAMTGIRWEGDFPKSDFEVTLEARRLEGPDFFCGMTFPVEGGYATLILGGWGGSIVGLSNIDGFAANDNETTSVVDFKDKQWYRIHLLVTEGHVDVWIDDHKVIEVKTKERRFEVWPQQEDARPFGIATWYTTGAVRNIKLRRLGSGLP